MIEPLLTESGERKRRRGDVVNDRSTCKIRTC